MRLPESLAAGGCVPGEVVARALGRRVSKPAGNADAITRLGVAGPAWQGWLDVAHPTGPPMTGELGHVGRLGSQPSSVVDGLGGPGHRGQRRLPNLKGVGRPGRNADCRSAHRPAPAEAPGCAVRCCACAQRPLNDATDAAQGCGVPNRSPMSGCIRRVVHAGGCGVPNRPLMSAWVRHIGGPGGQTRRVDGRRGGRRTRPADQAGRTDDGQAAVGKRLAVT